MNYNVFKDILYKNIQDHVYFKKHYNTVLTQWLSPREFITKLIANNKKMPKITVASKVKNYNKYYTIINKYCIKNHAPIIKRYIINTPISFDYINDVVYDDLTSIAYTVKNNMFKKALREIYIPPDEDQEEKEILLQKINRKVYKDIINYTINLAKSELMQFNPIANMSYNSKRQVNGVRLKFKNTGTEFNILFLSMDYLSINIYSSFIYYNNEDIFYEAKQFKISKYEDINKMQEFISKLIFFVKKFQIDRLKRQQIKNKSNNNFDNRQYYGFN